MLTKVVLYLAVVCFARTFGGIPYTGRSRTGGPETITGGDPLPGGPDTIPIGVSIPGGVETIPGGVPLPGGPMPGGPMPGGPMPGGPMPGGPGVPGGVGECLAVTPFHRQLASYALMQMGATQDEYTLRRIMGVRTQVVAGTMYHLDLHVSRNIAANYCENCEVRIWQQLNGRFSLSDGPTCTAVCCH